MYSLCLLSTMKVFLFPLKVVSIVLLYSYSRRIRNGMICKTKPPQVPILSVWTSNALSFILLISVRGETKGSTISLLGDLSSLQSPVFTGNHQILSKINSLFPPYNIAISAACSIWGRHNSTNLDNILRKDLLRQTLIFLLGGCTPFYT